MMCIDNVNNLFLYLAVYGNLPDVSVAAFVETQLNCSNRTSWDPTVIDLSVVESDGEHQDLLHWLVRFPVSVYFCEF